MGKPSSLEENHHSTESKSWLNKSLAFRVDLTFIQLKWYKRTGDYLYLGSNMFLLPIYKLILN